MSPRHKLLIEIYHRGTMVIDVADAEFQTKIGASQATLSVLIEDLARLTHINSRYTTLAGSSVATYTVSITERGREMARDVIRDNDEASDEPAHVILRTIADEVGRGDHPSKPVAIVFEDGSIRRVGVSKDRALARLVKAVFGAVK